MEPWHEPAIDYWGSVICALFANSNRDPAKRKDPFKPQDFLPDFLQKRIPEPEPQSRKEMWGELVTFFKNRAAMVEAREKKRLANEARSATQPKTRYTRRGRQPTDLERLGDMLEPATPTDTPEAT